MSGFSLDGIIAEQDTEFYRFCRAVPGDPEHEAWLVSSLERAGVQIMGEVTYQMMAQYFPRRRNHRGGHEPLTQGGLLPHAACR